MENISTKLYNECQLNEELEEYDIKSISSQETLVQQRTQEGSSLSWKSARKETPKLEGFELRIYSLRTIKQK